MVLCERKASWIRRSLRCILPYVWSLIYYVAFVRHGVFGMGTDHQMHRQAGLGMDSLLHGSTCLEGVNCVVDTSHLLFLCQAQTHDEHQRAAFRLLRTKTRALFRRRVVYIAFSSPVKRLWL